MQAQAILSGGLQGATYPAPATYRITARYAGDSRFTPALIGNEQTVRGQWAQMTAQPGAWFRLEVQHPGEIGWSLVAALEVPPPCRHCERPTADHTDAEARRCAESLLDGE